MVGVMGEMGGRGGEPGAGVKVSSDLLVGIVAGSGWGWELARRGAAVSLASRPPGF